MRPSVRNEGTEVGLRPAVLVRRGAAADDEAGGGRRDAAQVTQERRLAVVGIRIPEKKLIMVIVPYATLGVLKVNPPPPYFGFF